VGHEHEQFGRAEPGSQGIGGILGAGPVPQPGPAAAGPEQARREQAAGRQGELSAQRQRGDHHVGQEQRQPGRRRTRTGPEPEQPEHEGNAQRTQERIARGVA
jgi:hypothetical protein